MQRAATHRCRCPGLELKVYRQVLVLPLEQLPDAQAASLTQASPKPLRQVLVVVVPLHPPLQHCVPAVQLPPAAVPDWQVDLFGAMPLQHVPLTQIALLVHAVFWFALQVPGVVEVSQVNPAVHAGLHDEAKAGVVTAWMIGLAATTAPTTPARRMRSRRVIPADVASTAPCRAVVRQARNNEPCVALDRAKPSNQLPMSPFSLERVCQPWGHPPGRQECETNPRPAPAS